MSKRNGIHMRDNGGLRRMIRDLEELSDSLSPESVKGRLDAVTEEVTEGLRATMPIRTGNLKRSGHWTSEVSANEYTAEIEFGGPTAPYAPFVIGRGVNGHRPWDDVLPAFEERYEDAINGIWDHAMRY